MKAFKQRRFNMLDNNELVNMMNYIREKTTRCRSDIANVFDRISELDSIANAIEQHIRESGGPVMGSPVGGGEIHNVNDIDEEGPTDADAEGQMTMEFEEATAD